MRPSGDFATTTAAPPARKPDASAWLPIAAAATIASVAAPSSHRLDNIFIVFSPSVRRGRTRLLGCLSRPSYERPLSHICSAAERLSRQGRRGRPPPTASWALRGSPLDLLAGRREDVPFGPQRVVEDEALNDRAVDDEGSLDERQLAGRLRFPDCGVGGEQA